MDIGQQGAGGEEMEPEAEELFSSLGSPSPLSTPAPSPPSPLSLAQSLEMSPIVYLEDENMGVMATFLPLGEYDRDHYSPK